MSHEAAGVTGHNSSHYLAKESKLIDFEIWENIGLTIFLGFV